MIIIIETISHKEHRYETVGDWVFDKDGNLMIKVSEMGCWKYEALVGLHEAIEALLCKSRGISEEDVTKFDVAYERHRDEDDISEPGDQYDAPYRREHFTATNIERQLAEALDVNWQQYDAVVNSL